MHIYFTGTASAQISVQKEYEKIITILEKKGHTVLVDTHIARSKKSIKRKDKRAKSVQQSTLNKDKFFESIEKYIHTCDLVVAEASFPTTVMYHELSYAVEMKKPILALYHEKDTALLKPLILGDSDAVVVVKPYTSNSLKKAIETGIDEMLPHTQEHFTFSLTPMLQTYLTWISEHRKINRSTFIRGLVEEKMHKDVEYKKYVKGVGSGESEKLAKKLKEVYKTRV